MSVDLWGNIIDKNADIRNQLKVSPYTVIDTSNASYIALKRKWGSILKENGETREEELFNIRRNTGIQKRNNAIATKKQMRYQYGNKNISLFDPVISQICYEWFCPKGGLVFDPFAGDTRKGDVIAHLGGQYIGVDIRKEQVEHNNDKAINGAIWYCDNGLNIGRYLPENGGDMLFSCPPYFNLEVYSQLSEDVSNADTYNDFIRDIRNIFSEAISHLKQNRFACIVIGNIRRQKSRTYLEYYPFKEDIMNIFNANGCKYYNDIVIFKRNGTAHLRAVPYFKARKMVPIHEYLMVFYKGDINKIKQIFK